MILHPGHADGTRVVHLTHTTLLVEALCGVTVDTHGEPDLAEICDDCLAHAVRNGEDVSILVRQTEIVVQLPLAA